MPVPVYPNYTHLTAADFREHTAYTTEETNEALSRLATLRDRFLKQNIG